MAEALQIERGVRKLRLWHARWTAHRTQDALYKTRARQAAELGGLRKALKRAETERDVAQKAFLNRVGAIGALQKKYEGRIKAAAEWMEKRERRFQNKQTMLSFRLKQATKLNAKAVRLLGKLALEGDHG